MVRSSGNWRQRGPQRPAIGSNSSRNSSLYPASSPTECDSLNPEWGESVFVTNLVKNSPNSQEYGQNSMKYNGFSNLVGGFASGKRFDEKKVYSHFATKPNGGAVFLADEENYPPPAQLTTEMLNPGWEDIDISHIIKRHTEKMRPLAKPEKKEPVAVNVSNIEQASQVAHVPSYTNAKNSDVFNAKQLASKQDFRYANDNKKVEKSAPVAQEDEDPLNPGWETINIRHILQRMKDQQAKQSNSGNKKVHKSVDSGVTSLGDKTEAKQINSMKELSEISNVDSDEFLPEKLSGSKALDKMVRKLEFTPEEVHEFHLMMKACAESFDNVSKFFLKLGSRC